MVITKATFLPNLFNKTTSVELDYINFSKINLIISLISSNE